MARALFAILLALLLAVPVIRNAAAGALAELAPAQAARVWPGHPAVEMSLGLTQIAQATYERRAVGGPVFDRIYDAASKAPLAPESFLVRGVQARVAGQTRVAEQSFLAAERRDPRSLPARFFLAELYFRSGDAERGLQQIAVLARLAPNGFQSVAPYLAAYAKDRSNWPQLRKLFRSDPALRDTALAALANDAANADVILALAGDRLQGSRPSWAPTLIASLVKAGQYRKAHTLWATSSSVRVQPGTLLYDPGFANAEAPPPFNWELTSSTVGLAERQPGGRLHVIFYGQEDGVLAKQLLLLGPGTYRMAMQVAGDLSRARALSWSMRCENSQTPFATVPLDAASRGWTIRVPQGCGAQWLELSGSSSDIPQQSDVTISGLRLTPERPNA